MSEIDSQSTLDSDEKKRKQPPPAPVPPVQTVEARRVGKKRRTGDTITAAADGATLDNVDEEQEEQPHSLQLPLLPTVTTEQPSILSAASSATTSSSDPRTSKLVLSEEQRLAKMTTACRTILECIGEDPDREGLVKTPERWAKALLYMCSGYQLHPSTVTNGAVFDERHNEMVVVRNIDIQSLCEHHMVPFLGRVHIGYIPNGKIIGLSKLARIAELYARRLQVQERLTRQIADAIVETVQPLGVAVVMESTHLCMVMRGVQKTGALTTTSSVRGVFERNSKTRAEFFSIINSSSGGPKLF